MVWLLCLVAVAAIGSGDAAAQSISGTAAYSAAGVLPADAVFDATLEDVSRADAPSTVIASTRLPAPGSSPIAFTIAYDPARIDEARRYVVRARIRSADRLLFTSETATPVLTQGSPAAVSMTLRAVGGQPGTSPPPAPPAGELEGTSWSVVELYGTAVTTAASAPGREPYLEFGANGRLAGSDGCNRVMGSYAVEGNRISFGPLAGTRMACPGTEEVVNRFHAALKGTGHWDIRDGRLEFFGATGKPLAVLERRPTGIR